MKTNSSNEWTGTSRREDRRKDGGGWPAQKAKKAERLTRHTTGVDGLAVSVL